MGYDRYAGPIAGQTLAHLYGTMRLDESTGEPYFTGTPEELEDSVNGVELTVRVHAFPH